MIALIRANETGYFMKALVELPLGKLLPARHLIAVDSYISSRELCDFFSNVNKVPCVFERMTDQAYMESR